MTDGQMSRGEQNSLPPLVSIVTPVYNGEPYLRECVESVLAQTYPSWDYTIVNNCSTDNTREIALAYAARDSRIRVHDNTTFVGAIANENNAVRQISPDSRYCKMVFADDWLFPECLERMVEVAEAHPSVAIVGAYGLRGTEVAWDGLPFPSTVLSGRDVCRRKLLYGIYPFGTESSVLYRSDVIRARDPFFNESNLHADKEACFELLQRHDFGFVHQVLTFTRVREGSLTAFADRFNTYLPGILNDLITYGPIYLTRAEQEQLLRNHVTKYYEFLGFALFERRESAFWAYHKEKMQALGFPMSYGRLSRVAAGRVLDVLFNPKRTIEGVWRRVRRSAR